MVRRRSQDERTADTKARLRAATEETLLSHGFANASTVEICRLAGVSRGAMLHHYPTKKDLIIDTARCRFERASQEMANLAVALGRGELTVDQFIDGMWEQVFPNRAVILTLESLVASRSDPELQEVIGGYFETMFSGYEAVARGAFGDAGFSVDQRHVLVLLTACAVRGLRHQELMYPNAATTDMVKQALKHTIKSVLAAGPERLGRAIAPIRRTKKPTARLRVPARKILGRTTAKLRSGEQ